MKTKRKSYSRRRPTRKQPMCKTRRRRGKSKRILKKYRKSRGNRKSKRISRKKRGGLVKDEERIIEYIYNGDEYGLNNLVTRGNLSVNTIINNIDEFKGRSLLYIAVKLGKKKIVKYLLENGADPNKQYQIAGFTPLFHTVVTKQLKFTKILLKGGADPNIKNNEGVSPLHNAVMTGDVDVVKILLSSPLIDVNIKMTDTNVTPLSTAIAKKDVKIINLLVSAGANEPKLYKLTSEEVDLLMNEIEQAYPPGHEKYTDTMNLPNFKKYLTRYYTKKGLKQGNFKTYNIDDDHPDDLYNYLKDKIEGYFKGYGLT